AGLSQYLIPALARAPRERWGEVWGDVVRFHIRATLPLAALFAGAVGLAYHGTTRWVLLATVPWWMIVRVTLSLRAFLTVAEKLVYDARAALVEMVLTLAAVEVTIAVTGSSVAAAAS